MWRKHKSADESNKTEIMKEINNLTEKIDTIQAHKKACNRIIARFEQIKEDYKKEIEAKEKVTELIKEDNHKKLRANRG